MPAPKRWSAENDERELGRDASLLGERLRQLALGLTAALMTARAFWPSEPDLKEGAGSGLTWVLAIFAVAGLVLAASLTSGRFRFRFSRTDVLLVGLTILVAQSAAHALDRRPAINLAWEWVGLGLTYLLLRNLPRTRNESSTLAGVLIATAVAVSAYGLYQVAVELPLLQAEYQRNPRLILQRLNIEPGSRGEEMLKNRLMYSNEPWSTFALANSLAGFIVGPLVMVLAVGFTNLSDLPLFRQGERPGEPSRDAARTEPPPPGPANGSLANRGAPGSLWTALALAAPVMLVLLVCLLLTKSRSAYVALGVAMIFLGWRARRQVGPRALWAAGLAGLGIVAALVIAGLATRQLDREVLTQSMMSLRYRWEYWQGAWGVITGGATGVMSVLSSPVFWSGVGPGNFGGPYLKFKLPESSEEILDPHNMVLEVWATAGFWAFLALVVALLWGAWNVLGPAWFVDSNGEPRTRRMRRRDGRLAAELGEPSTRDNADDVDAAPPSSASWLIALGGVGGWSIVVMLGRLNPFEGDLFWRWMILGGSWLAAVLLGAPLWRRLPLSATAVGAAFLAGAINLLASGGIGIPTVALGLWSTLALGLNLRDDRRCGVLREYRSRIPAFSLAAVWAAVLGSFFGLVVPFWRSEAAMAEAQSAVNRRPPDFDGADLAYRKAVDEDRYNARPWRELAYVHFVAWQQQGAKAEDHPTRWSWKTVPYLYQMAATPPRNPNSWSVHSERSRVIHQLLNAVGPKLSPLDLLRYRGEIVKSTRAATRLHPTNTELHARLADASAEINMFQDAVDEATLALRLDGLTPHRDKKLPEAVRKHLEALIPAWQESAAKTPIKATR
jgi:O-antigen ligase